MHGVGADAPPGGGNPLVRDGEAVASPHAARALFVREHMRAREEEFLRRTPHAFFVGTWNVNGQESVESLLPWLDWEGHFGGTGRCCACPDFCLISLQEIDRRPEALVLAGSAREAQWNTMLLLHMQTAAAVHGCADERGRPRHDYVLVASHALVGIYAGAFARRDRLALVAEPAFRAEASEILQDTDSYRGAEAVLSHVRVGRASAGCGFMGTAGNKGGVALRMRVGDEHVVFVSSHLAPHTHNVARRNQDYAELLRRLRFDVPAAGGPYVRDDGFSVMDASAVFWAGDLNYRVDMDEAAARLLAREGNYAALYAADQLRAQMRAGRAFEPFIDGPSDPEVELDASVGYASSPAIVGRAGTVSSHSSSSLSCAARSGSGSAGSVAVPNVGSTIDDTPLPSAGATQKGNGSDTTAGDTQLKESDKQSDAPATVIDEQLNGRKGLDIANPTAKNQSPDNTGSNGTDIANPTAKNQSPDNTGSNGADSVDPTAKNQLLNNTGSNGTDILDPTAKNQSPDNLHSNEKNNAISMAEEQSPSGTASKESENGPSNAGDMPSTTAQLTDNPTGDSNHSVSPVQRPRTPAPFQSVPVKTISAPTFKYVIGTTRFDDGPRGRAPAWPDRVLHRRGDRVRCISAPRTALDVLGSDHKPVGAGYVADLGTVDEEAHAAVLASALRLLDAYENEAIPATELDLGSAPVLDFGSVAYMRGGLAHSIVLSNTGIVLAPFRLVSPPWREAALPPWLSAVPQTGVLLPGSHVEIALTAAVRDAAELHGLNCAPALSDTLIVHVEGGRDHFVPVEASFRRTVFGESLEALCAAGLAQVAVLPLPTERYDLSFRDVPHAVVRLVSTLCAADLRLDSVFLEPGDRQAVEALMDALDGDIVTAARMDGADAVAVGDVLLRFLDALPEPLVPRALFADALRSDDVTAFAVFRAMPAVHQEVFQYLRHYVRDVHLPRCAAGVAAETVAAALAQVVLKPPAGFAAAPPTAEGALYLDAQRTAFVLRFLR